MNNCYVCGQPGDMRNLGGLDIVVCDKHYYQYQRWLLTTGNKLNFECMLADVKKDILIDRLKSTKEELDNQQEADLEYVCKEVDDCFTAIQTNILCWLDELKEKDMENLSCKIGFI